MGHQQSKKNEFGHWAVPKPVFRQPPKSHRIIFASIPEHLQVDIYKKMEFSDIREFEISSRLGKRIARTINHRFTVNVDMMSVYGSVIIDESDISFCLYERKWDWRRIKDNPILPKFIVSRICVNHNTPNYNLELAVRLVEEVHVIPDSNVHLEWGQTADVQSGTFQRFIQKFKIDRFSGYDVILPDCLSHPVLQKIPWVSIYRNSVPEEVLLQFQAHSIHLHVPLPASTLNAFFQQWYNGTRRISHFAVVLVDSDSTPSILKDLKAQIVWSKAIHKSSCVSFMEISTMNSNLLEQICYFIQREDGKKLLVTQKPFSIEAREFDDEMDAVSEELGSVDFFQRD